MRSKPLPSTDPTDPAWVDDYCQIGRTYYFPFEQVEWELIQYLWTGCTNIPLRDRVMSHTPELINQLIRKNRLASICTGQEEATNDLTQLAWTQIERTLYKFNARVHCRQCFHPTCALGSVRPNESLIHENGHGELGVRTLSEIIEVTPECPHCGQTLTAVPFVGPGVGRFVGSDTLLYRGASNVFNFWTQITRTVCLAFIKRNERDTRYRLKMRHHLVERPVSTLKLDRFFEEQRELWRYHDDYLKLLDGLEELISIDPRPWDGLIAKLVQQTQLHRDTVTDFLKSVRLRGMDVSDSPLARKPLVGHGGLEDDEEDG